MDTRKHIDQRLVRHITTMSSVAILMLSGVLTHSVSAQTVIMPRIPKTTTPTPVVSSNALPSGTPNSTSSNLANGSTSQNPVYAPTVVSGQFSPYTVNQSTDTATITETSNAGILSWNSFNIGSSATVNIVQPSSTSLLLNRVTGPISQSLINGVLNANGAVYLYNPSGFIFGKNAVVNVNTLVASSLDINNTLFLEGILTPTANPNFAADPTLTGAPGNILVDGDGASQARLNAANGGKILLFAPNVTNNGIVTAPDGQVVMAAGGEVFLSAPTDLTMRGLYVAVNSSNLPAGTTTAVTNNGTVSVGRGNATLVGLAVNQDGIVSAQTSASLNGSIYLTAQTSGTRNAVGGLPTPTNGGTLTLGSGSITSVSIYDDGSTITQGTGDLAFKPSEVKLSGQSINLAGSTSTQEGAKIIAPGGRVTIAASANPGNDQFSAQDGSSVNLGSGSLIDVSGDASAVLPMSDNVISVQLLAELADNVTLRNSSIRGQTLNFDIRTGTSIADISADLGKLPFTVGQLAATGGAVSIESNGSLVQQAGSDINVSGGKVTYSSGYVNTSFLVSNGVLYSDSNAPSNLTYTGVVNKPDGRWDYQPGYAEGSSAGTVTVAAPEIVLQGSLTGTVTPGLYQREVGASNRPLGAELVIGTNPGSVNDSAYAQQFGYTGNIVLDNAETMPAQGSISAGLASDRLDVNVDSLNANGFTRIAAYSGSNITVAGPLALGAGGSLALTALGNISFDAGVSSPGGTVTAKAVHLLTVDSGASFNLAGTWRNDSKLTDPLLDANGNPAGDIVLNGGSFSLDANQIIIGNNVDINVSAGAWYSNKDKLTDGAGGSISIAVDTGLVEQDPVNTIAIGSNLQMQAYGVKQGGSLTLEATNVQIGNGGSISTSAGGAMLSLPADIFSVGGFSKFNIDGLYGLNVNDGAVIDAIAQNWIFSDLNRLKSEGSGAMTSVAAPGVLNLVGPESGRQPVDLTLSALGKNPVSGAEGAVVFGAGSVLQTDPQASVTIVANQGITIDGTIDAPAGSINLAFNSALSLGYDPTRAIWIGSDAHLFAQGSTALLYTNPNGSTTGSVLSGGTISIGGIVNGAQTDGDSGYVVIEQQSASGRQGGASLDVSGIATGPVTLAGQHGNNAAAPIASAGGSIQIIAREGILFGGSAAGAAGNSTQLGGSLSLTLSREGTTITGYPDQSPDVLNIIDGPIVNDLSGSVSPGGSLANLANQAWINTASFNNGGFDQLAFKSGNVIAIGSATTSATLNARTSLVLDAPVLALGNDSGDATTLTSVQVNSAYVQLGSDDYLLQNNPTANVLSNPNNNYFSTSTANQNNAASSGAATLTVNATTIDLAGASVVQGAQSTTLNAVQDIRLVGISKTNLAEGAGASTVAPALDQLMPTGEFSVAGTLTLNSAQVYPITLSSFALNVEGANSTLNFVSNTTKPYAPLTAAGTLYGFAQNINQDGTVTAPFGMIDLVAGNKLVYASGSTTSVAGSGIVPFGIVVNGRDWAYDFGNGNEVLFELNPVSDTQYAETTLPRKTIISSAPNISTESGATINLAGGGELYGYEFTAGSYGTVDVLKNNVSGSQTNVFAILPGYADAVAPRDYQYGQDGGLVPGESVYLSGIAGLPAGNYVLLPAHYALLPGAYEVTLTSTGLDAVSNQNLVNLNGTYSVAGSTNVLGLGSSRANLYTVAPGSVVREESQYQDYSVTSFFTTAAQTAGVTLPALPTSGGQLEFNASASLTLNGQFDLTASQNGVNGIVDISAPAIDVVSVATQSVPSGTLQLVASELNSLAASSLLLGGTRSTSNGTTSIEVGAQTVTVDNDASHPLSGTEILLAAQQNVTLGAGASVQATGTAVNSNNNLVILATNPDGSTVGTDGALLRVSTGSAVAVSRAAPAGVQGTLTIGNGASIAATGSAYLDSTSGMVNNGSLDLASGAALGLSAPRISLGNAIPAGATGLQLNAGALTNLDTLSSLTLNSYSTIDLYGTVTLGSTSMTSLTLNASGIQGNYASGAPGNANFVAQNVQLEGGGTFVPAGAVAAGSAGKLTITTGNLTAGNGNFLINGYGSVALNATGAVRTVGSGSLSAENDLSVSAASITASSGSNVTLAAGQNMTLASSGSSAAQIPQQAGGTIGFDANTIQSGANIEALSGTIAMTAANGLTLTGGTISTAGYSQVYGSTTAYTGAGSVSLNGGAGNVLVGSGATVDVSAVGASAGQLNIAATGSPTSTVALNGVFLGKATALSGIAAPTQGSFSLDAGQMATAQQLDQLATTMSQAGFTNAQSYRIRNGDVSLDAGYTLKAQQVTISADNGNLTIGGTINASGAEGGSISLFASQATAGGGSGNVNLLAGSVLNASATRAATSTTASTSGSIGTGGSVLVDTGSADGQMATGLSGGSVIQFAANAVINVSGDSQETNGDANGSVTFRAPQITGGNDVAISQLDGNIIGSKLNTVEGYKIYTAANISSAADHQNSDGTYSNLQAATTSGGVPTNGVMYKDAQNFGNGVAAAALATRSSPSLNFVVTPGIEVRSAGDLTVSVNETSSTAAARGWNLDTWYFQNAPVNLSLVAAGNLMVNGSISAGFIKSTVSTTAMPDWTLDSRNSGSITLVGGADLSAANPTNVIANTGSGNVEVNFVRTSFANPNDTPVALVRSGTGAIDIAAGGDVVLGTLTDTANTALTVGATVYTAGKSTPYNGTLGIFVAPTNALNTQYARSGSAAAQFAEDGGSVSILADQSVIGAPQQQLVNNWLFHQGDTTTDANGTLIFSTINGKTANTAWWTLPGYFDQGIATLGGGNVSVIAVNGNVQDVSVSAATNAFMPGTSPGALVERGGGNLLVEAGGNIAGGSFYAQTGTATISAGGSITSGSLQIDNVNVNPILALGNAQMTVTARGDVNIEAVYNPTMAVQSSLNSGVPISGDTNISDAELLTQFSNFSTYSNASAVSLTSLDGNVAMTNNRGGISVMSSMGQGQIPMATVDNFGDLPYDLLYTYVAPNLNLVALNGNISTTNGFSMAGSPTGELNILASGSININGSGSQSGIVMTDVSQAGLSPYYAPRYLDPNAEGDLGALAGSAQASELATHTASGLHDGDSVPVRIIALHGSITGDAGSPHTIWLPKFAEIYAGQNIQDLGFSIQNNASTDVTTVTAGNNITDSSSLLSTGSSVVHVVDGPGQIDFTAGNTIDLGDSAGIQTRGNLDNPYLNSGGASINLVAGTTISDYVNFAKNDVPVSQLSQSDQNALISYVNSATGGTYNTAGNAWSAFQNLSVAQQQQFLTTIKPDLYGLFFSDLVSTSHIAGLSQFDALIATLFPDINPNGGNINVFASQLKTIQGGSIYMFTPGGSVYAGLPTLPGFLQKAPSDEGIFTVAGGAVGALVHTNFEVDQGRVFTLGGGDITLVSQYGDLSAGEGTKTASSAPPPILTTDQNGNTVVDISGSIAGSGIATLQAYPDAPASNVYVIAPRGVFDAGDAGVRSSGSVDVNAVVVLNAGNIVAAGAISGVPTVESVNIGAGLSSSATPNVNDVAKNIAANAAGNGTAATNLTVDVLGYGNDDQGSSADSDADSATTAGTDDDPKKKRK